MRTSRAFHPLLASAAMILIGGWSFIGKPAISSTPEHERLRIHNDFKSPTDVVRYYAARDASGFVWTGLLDIERRAFTTWKEAPQHETFLVATRYEVAHIQERQNHPDEATVEVRYEVLGVGDANGTLVPADPKTHRVKFTLRKTQGHWKITYPVPQNVSPVVLEAKFPYVSWKQP